MAYFQNQKTYKRVFAKPQVYRGIQFRSTMERDFAMFLDGQIVKYKGINYYHKPIRWQYECKEFELIPQEKWVDRTEKDESVKTIKRNKSHTLQRVIYTPDFYLPDYDLLVEIKGFQFFNDLFKLRLRLFRHKFPEKPLVVIQHHSDFCKIDDAIKNLTQNN